MKDLVSIDTMDLNEVPWDAARISNLIRSFPPEPKLEVASVSHTNCRPNITVTYQNQTFLKFYTTDLIRWEVRVFHFKYFQDLNCLTEVIKAKSVHYLAVAALHVPRDELKFTRDGKITRKLIIHPAAYEILYRIHNYVCRYIDPDNRNTRLQAYPNVLSERSQQACISFFMLYMREHQMEKLPHEMS